MTATTATTDTTTRPIPTMPITTIRFAALPAKGSDLDGGTFAGITTQADGTHTAVVRLPGFGVRLTHSEAQADAEQRGGRLPTKAEAALITSNLAVDYGWYWTGQDLEGEPSCAWGFDSYGCTLNFRKSSQGGALAVRLIQITD